MLKTILIIIVSVSIFGIIFFSFVRRALKKKLDEIVNENKENS